MTLAKFANRAERLVTNNAPLIMTAIGVTGTLTAVILGSKASFKAAAILDNAEYEAELMNEPPLNIKEQAQLVWKLYIPTAGVSIVTIICIVGANRIGTRRAAAMAAAYSLSEKAFSEYKDKVIDTIGVNKEQKVRDGLAQDRVDNDPVTTREVIITGNGDVLCYDSITGRYFLSTMETLRKAQNDINERIINDGHATLHEFFSVIGLEATLYSSEVGWNSDSMLELQFSTTMSNDNRPCISLEYATYPIRNYYAHH